MATEGLKDVEVGSPIFISHVPPPYSAALVSYRSAQSLDRAPLNMAAGKLRAGLAGLGRSLSSTPG
jgi:hypothetical protein